MDEAPNNYTNIDNQSHYSSTIPWANKFNFDEEADLSKIFEFDEETDLSKIFSPQEQPVNTPIIPNTSIGKLHQNFDNVSELPNVVPKEQQPMTTTNIPSYSSTDKNSSRITYPVTLDDDDDYSLSYMYSMGLNNVSMLQKERETGNNSISDGINIENPKTFIPMPIGMEKQGDTSNISRKRDQEIPKSNGMLLQQPLPKIPILEKLEREASLKSKFIIDQPLRTSIESCKGQENPKAKDPHMPKNSCLQRDFMKPTCHSSFGILEQKKLMTLNQGSDFFMNHPYGISTSRKAGEHENPKTNGMILQRPMSHILTLEKLESHFMKSKLMVGQENEIFKQPIIGSGGYGILSSLDNEFPQKTSTNGGPIRRSPNKTNSRYQPFGKEIDPNNQGSHRVRQSSSESIFNGTRISKKDIVRNIGKLWNNQLNEIKSKIGIASDYATPYDHRYNMLNNIQEKSDSSQVAEIGKQNGNNEETFVQTSSNMVYPSNHNFPRSPAYTHEITNQFKGVASGENFNQYTQGNVYSNQARSLNSRKENEDGAPDELHKTHPTGLGVHFAKEGSFHSS